MLWRKAKTAIIAGKKPLWQCAMDFVCAPLYACPPCVSLSCSTFRAPVAQLDRVLPSEGRGHWFDSSRARHKIKSLRFGVGFFFVNFEFLLQFCCTRSYTLYRWNLPAG